MRKEFLQGAATFYATMYRLIIFCISLTKEVTRTISHRYNYPIAIKIINLEIILQIFKLMKEDQTSTFFGELKVTNKVNKNTTHCLLKLEIVFRLTQFLYDRTPPLTLLIDCFMISRKPGYQWQQEAWTLGLWGLTNTSISIGEVNFLTYNQNMIRYMEHVIIKFKWIAKKYHLEEVVGIQTESVPFLHNYNITLYLSNPLFCQGSS